MKNAVLEGKYKNKDIFNGANYVAVNAGFFKSVMIDKSTVRAYELVTEDHQKSMASGIARGIVGHALLGPAGLVVGAISGKKKGSYHVAIEWNDGERSLVHIDDKAYKTLMRVLF
jgi:hypothetical protein